VTDPRRRVRATPRFFHQLDQLLPAERTERSPSRADFETLDLLRAVEAFADGFDSLRNSSPGDPTTAS